MNIIIKIQGMLTYISGIIPLELFAFLGTFIEEVVAPIPSPFVMTLVGTLAQAQRKSTIEILTIALIGSVGKTIGSYIVYVISDKLEDYIIPKFGKFFGTSHENIENIGNKIKSSWRDDFFIFSSRVLPFVPTAPVSIVCGILKIDKKTFILATFFGNIFRNIIFLYVGYVGMNNYAMLIEGFNSLESIFMAALFIGFLAFLFWGYKNRDKD